MAMKLWTAVARFKFMIISAISAYVILVMSKYVLVYVSDDSR